MGRPPSAAGWHAGRVLPMLRVLLAFGAILMALAHLYFRVILTTVPPGWSVNDVENIGLGAAAVLGVGSRALSRRLAPVALGAVAGILLGAYRAGVSDVTISMWQQVMNGLLRVYALCLWSTFVGAWFLVDLAVRRRKLRASANSA